METIEALICMTLPQPWGGSLFGEEENSGLKAELQTTSNFVGLQKHSLTGPQPTTTTNGRMEIKLCRASTAMRWKILHD